MYRYKVNITKVYDGDSVTADIDLGFHTWLRNQKFRLIFIDTPEIRNKDEILKSKAYAARDFVREAIDGKQCTIKSHGKGKYGRWLVELFIEGMDISVNQKLLDLGHAKPYKP